MKKVLALVLIVLALGGSTLAFAWWDNLETTQNNITVGVGEGVTISVDLEDQTAGTLVPSGVVMKTGDVTEVEVEFEVSLDQTNLLSALSLNVDVLNIEIDGDATYASLVNTSIDNPGSIQNDNVTVTITITLDMPDNQTEYDAVANKNITFDVTFTASQ